MIVLNIHESIDDLRKIGIGKFIATYIIMAIIMFLIVFVCELILGVISTLLLGVSLPGIHIVALITFLIINPFIYLFQGQTLGLLYSNAE